MADLLPTLIFYLFAGITVLSALMVISSKNPVHSVLFLILAFFNAAGLFVLIGAEFLAMILVIVYVGAVAVLFLFVVMMLDIDIAELREGFLRYLPLGLVVAAAVFAELFLALRWSLASPQNLAMAGRPIPAEVSNTRAIGDVLYTWYLYPFQLSGIILLIAMIGAIVLTLRARPQARRQNIKRQIARTKRSGVEIVKVQSGEGIS
ncbi:MAG: NADH-quinone oxidoreductase subunit J [Pseudomonadota bacterium]|nr:NADH-quinone oxidoreductase subunit J [Pseudomonadota bacterium]MDE3038354.1 NADH-quinone oxidoreductase subunit J [Pseudomonadota bacterium]